MFNPILLFFANIVHFIHSCKRSHSFVEWGGLYTLSRQDSKVELETFNGYGYF